jgi:hypothetical protein
MKTIYSHNRLGICLALALALMAIAVPAASARFELNPPIAANQTSNPTYAPPAVTPQSPASAQIVRVFQPNGFDWGDAGIGGAAVFGLALVLLGSTLYATHRRTARLG